MFNSRRLAAVLATPLVLAACGGDDADTGSSTVAPESSMVDEMTDDDSADDTTDDSLVDDMTDDSMADDMTDDSMADDMDDEMATLAAWQSIEIVDTEGNPFTIAELAGTPVLVEPFATWCSNCRSQLADTNAAAATLGDDAIVLAVSIETELDAATVAEYASSNGFDAIRFAVASPELLAAMVDQFGPGIANPPSTPKVVVAADGSAADPTTGGESAESLVARLSS